MSKDLVRGCSHVPVGLYNYLPIFAGASIFLGFHSYAGEYGDAQSAGAKTMRLRLGETPSISLNIFSYVISLIMIKS